MIIENTSFWNRHGNHVVMRRRILLTAMPYGEDMPSWPLMCNRRFRLLDAMEMVFYDTIFV